MAESKARSSASPPWGAVSAARQAIAGGDGYLFPLRRYDAYAGRFLAPHLSAGPGLTRATAERHGRYSSEGKQIISVFVPAKATCLPDVHPLLLPTPTTPAWRMTRLALRTDPGMLFCDELVEASRSEKRHRCEPWRRTDTGLAPEGVAILLRAILARLGIKEPRVRTETREAESFLGNLSGEWGMPVYEESSRHSVDLEGNPELTDHTGDGRRIWSCPDATFAAPIAVIAPPGPDSNRLLTQVEWWISRLFQTSLTATHDNDLADFAPEILIWLIQEEALARSATVGPRTQGGVDGA